jgi:hypothetical protein
VTKHGTRRCWARRDPLAQACKRLFDNFVTHVLAERQAEARFVVRQKRGNPECVRKLLATIRQRVKSAANKPWSEIF